MFKRLKWELIGVDKSSAIPMEEMETYRAAVPGGWLVTVWADVVDKATAKKRGNEIGPGHWGGGLTFVPDPEHKWVVDTVE